MTFKEWLSSPCPLAATPELAAEQAWHAAVARERERAAKVADDYSAGFEAAQAFGGAAWCPKCGEYVKDVADSIAARIREGK